MIVLIVVYLVIAVQWPRRACCTANTKCPQVLGERHSTAGLSLHLEVLGLAKSQKTNQKATTIHTRMLDQSRDI